MINKQKNLNLDTFNELLFDCFKDEKKTPEGKLEFYEMEMGMIGDVFIDKVSQLLDELVENGYESELFTQVKNIKKNSEHIVEEYTKLKEQVEKRGDQHDSESSNK